MTYPSFSRRTASSLAFAAMLLSALLPAGTAFAADEPRFELRPHCAQEDVAKNLCKKFATRDPQSFQTDPLRIGDTLDLDLVILNPGNASVSRFSAWMGYDPTIFSGSLIEVDSGNFPTTDDAGTMFSVADGYVKVAGSSPAGAKGTEIIAGRISVTITKTPISSTVISFYDATKKTASHTAVIVTVDGKEQNIASGANSYLYVRMNTTPPASSASSVATSASAQSASQASSVSSETSVATGTGSSVSSSQASSAQAVAFSLLQPQGVRVTTDGGSAFLAWNQLNAGSLLGYNVYYGTVSGKYIQRRSVEKASTTLTIRSLPVGTKYYFAVRGVDANNQESDFSQEVAVTIGNPSTSTSPLTGNLSDLGPGGKTPGNGGKVAGDTGPASTMLLLIALSSVAGILLAFRRQFSARA